MLVIFILRLVCSGIISGGGVDRLSAYYEWSLLIIKWHVFLRE